jgi:hypothetical protein
MAIELNAAPQSFLVSEADLSGFAVKFSASPASALVASAALIGKTAKLAAYPSSSLVATVTLSGKTAQLSARPTSALIGTVTLSGRTARFAASPASALQASMALSGIGADRGMSLCDVVNEVLLVWGVEGKCSAPSFALARAVNDVNGALQTIWNQANDRNYWTSSTVTVVFADGESEKALANDIQNVVGPCRLASNNRVLTTVGTIGEIENFADLFLDGAIASGPVGYHISRERQSEDDPAKCTLIIAPAASGSTSILLEVVKEAPRYTVADLNSCPLIPIPHKYAESLLLPVARYMATSFFLFSNQEAKESIDAEYAIARKALGTADPLPGKAGDNLNRREAQS